MQAAAFKHDRGELVNRNLMRPYRGDRDLSPAELVDKAGSFPFGAMLLRREVVEKLPDWYFRCPVGDRPLELLAALKGYCHYADRFDSVYRFHGAGSWTEEMKSGSRMPMRSPCGSYTAPLTGRAAGGTTAQRSRPHGASTF